jgi:CspA family cold shock protein
MAIGTVKWFDPRRGYGFIQPEDGSQDVFVHISAVERSGIGNLQEGQLRARTRRSRKDLGRQLAASLAQAGAVLPFASEGIAADARFSGATMTSIRRCEC